MSVSEHIGPFRVPLKFDFATFCAARKYTFPMMHSSGILALFGKKHFAKLGFIEVVFFLAKV